MTIPRRARGLLLRGQQFARRTAYHLIKTPVVAMTRTPRLSAPAPIYPGLIRTTDWRIRDETWDRVRYRWPDRAAMQTGRPFAREDVDKADETRINWLSPHDLDIFVPEGTPDRWVFAYISPTRVSLGDFEWSFSVTRYTPFQELQLGFRFVDFYNRYRVRHERDVLHYDVVRNGRFINNLSVARLPMQIGRPYQFHIAILRNRFCVQVDGRTVFDEWDILSSFSRGTVALVLWDHAPQPAISASIREMHIGH